MEYRRLDRSKRFDDAEDESALAGTRRQPCGRVSARLAEPDAEGPGGAAVAAPDPSRAGVVRADGRSRTGDRAGFRRPDGAASQGGADRRRLRNRAAPPDARPRRGGRPPAGARPFASASRARRDRRSPARRTAEDTGGRGRDTEGAGHRLLGHERGRRGTAAPA
ncbi:hypothetical protein EON77_17545 [bacterium]|nr:MAG: hypothetical protein EON77_17545 [bacterium]